MYHGTNKNIKSIIPNNAESQKIRTDGLSQEIMIAINFLNMGEKEVAREMLQDIVKSGSEADKKQAKDILESEF